MKVLQIINSLHTGGAEKLLVDSLPLYSESDIEVDLLLLNTVETPFLKKLKENFKGKIYISKVKNCYSPLQILEIKKYIKMDYAIIHAHLFPVLYWVSLAKMIFGTNSKLIFTEHNTENRRLNHYLFRQIDKFIYWPYLKIISITPQVKNVLMQKLHFAEDRVTVVYNGIDVEKFQNAKPYSKNDFFNDNCRILIQVSRFEAQKNQKLLIKALSLLPEKYTLLLVGDGEKKEECEVLCRELGVLHRVKFLGIRMDIPELLNTADIVVQSSNFEGFGLAAVEGMASGKPVIASNVSGLKEVVENYGLVFDNGDENDLVNKILLLEDDHYYVEIATKCSKRALDFKIGNMVNQNIQVYREI